MMLIYITFYGRQILPRLLNAMCQFTRIS